MPDDYITIPLNGKKHPGRVALVDRADFDLVNNYTWWVVARGESRLYAAGRLKGSSAERSPVYMHRVILGFPKGMPIDHINHDGLDNRRSNLRVATAQENTRNARKHYTKNSQYKGVIRRTTKSWLARIVVDGKRIHLGAFPTEKEAARAYNRAASELFGEFAFLNDVD